jgi:serine/threonine protein kinase
LDTNGSFDLEVDRRVLSQQRERLLARLFGIESTPRCINHYQLLEIIGQGGMGTVFLANDLRLDRKVAIKVVLEPMDAANRYRVLREARILARLQHQNIVGIHDLREFEGLPYIVMEFIDGVTLREWLQQGDRASAEIIRVFIEAGRGLEAAHAKRVIHRDFKPENVMVDANGDVLVMDFGLARSEVSRSWDCDGRDANHLIGTLAYMAPEQWLSRTITTSIDQFAFCVALWEALHGERPFPGAIGEGGEQDWRIRRPAWSAELRGVRRVLRRGLSVHAHDRFASMTALLRALESVQRRTRRRVWLANFLIPERK